MDAVEKVRAGRMTLDELRGILKLVEAAASRDPSTEGVKGYA